MVIYTCSFVLPLDPWGRREPLKVKVATCPRTGGSYTHMYTPWTLSVAEVATYKKKDTKKKKSKKRPPLSGVSFLPACRWWASLTSGAWQASEGPEWESPLSSQPWCWGGELALAGSEGQGTATQIQIQTSTPGPGAGREGRRRDGAECGETENHWALA